MRQSLFVLFLLASLPVGVAASGALLPAAIDQSHENPGGYSANRWVSQSFTVGQSGILDRVEVPLRPSGILNDPQARTTVMLRLARITNGVPGYRQSDTISSKILDLPVDDAPLFESEIASLAGFHWVSLSDIGLAVNVGE